MEQQGPVYPPAWDNQMSRQTYEAAFSKTGHQATNGTDGYEARTNNMRGVTWESFQATVQRGGIRAELADSLSWGVGAESSERLKCLMFPGQGPGEKLHAERTLEFLLVRVYKQNWLRPGKKPSGGIRGNGDQHWHRAGNSAWCSHVVGREPVLPASLRNLLVQGELDRILRRTCLRSGEWFTLDYILPWSCLTNIKNKTRKDWAFSRQFSCSPEQSSGIFIGAQNYPALNKGESEYSASNQRLLGIQRCRKKGPIMRRKINELKPIQNWHRFSRQAR